MHYTDGAMTPHTAAAKRRRRSKPSPEQLAPLGETTPDNYPLDAARPGGPSGPSPDLPPIMDDMPPMLDMQEGGPHVEPYSPWTPAVGEVVDDREVDLGGVVVHVEQYVWGMCVGVDVCVCSMCFDHVCAHAFEFSRGGMY